MPFKIAIASGKGGTGKTTVSINLFNLLNERLGDHVALLDCDVEEPNDIIFFNDIIYKDEREISQSVPFIDKDICSFCRGCADYCEFNAIVIIPPVKFAEINKSLCHSCGACIVACKQNAIKGFPESIGNMNSYVRNGRKNIFEGKLKIGSARQTMLIKEVKKQVPKNHEIILYDAPPGTSCPVVVTIIDADYVILVAEPTLFGLHDLKLMVKLTKELNIPFGIVINKSGLGDRSIYDFIELENLELLGEIPFSKEYASLYAKGRIFDSVPEEISDAYMKILNKMEKKFVVKAKEFINSVQ